MRGRWGEEEVPNFWPAVADVFIGFLALVLIAGLTAYTTATRHGQKPPAAKRDFRKQLEDAFVKIESSKRPEVISEGFSELTIRFPGDFLFEPCETTPKATAGLIQLKTALRKSRDAISRVEITGHTDTANPGQKCLQQGIRTNWELSARRAIAVLERLAPVNEEDGIDPRRLWAAALGQYHPVEPDKGAESMAKNRRIEVLIRFSETPSSFRVGDH